MNVYILSVFFLNLNSIELNLIRNCHVMHHLSHIGWARFKKKNLKLAGHWLKLRLFVALPVLI